MYFRSFSVALVSSLVASGAYFAYRGAPQSGDIKLGASPVNGLAQQTRSLSSGNGLPSGGLATDLGQTRERKALIVDNYQLYTGVIPGTAPLEKTTDDQGRKILEMMTPAQATQRIRRNEESFWVGRGKGVVRYDVVQLPSNDPIEDDHIEKIIEAPHATVAGTDSNDWMFWGVFDGHSGWTTSAKLRQTLISYVARELNTTYTSSNGQQPALPTPSSIDAAIKRGFLALDKSIVHDSVAQVMKNKSKAQAAALLAPAISGSCALLSFYDSASKTLRVACTGDSRAVLGRRSTNNAARWVAMPLSVDQTGGNEEEAARLRAEHPNEPNVVRNGRVLGGLEPSRAFGDATYKWSKETQDFLRKEYFGRANGNIQTPPYVTAEPVVTTTKVQPEKGDFVVMATDGLWEMLTNEEVVGLVGSWLEKHPEAQSGGRSVAGAVSSSDAASAEGWLSSWFSSQKASSSKELPVASESVDNSAAGGQRAPIRQQQWGLSSSDSGKRGAPSSSRFVVEDKNAATHLIRNALGGANQDMVSHRESSVTRHVY
jgi:pyruvate dehydrogenase phosphatase